MDVKKPVSFDSMKDPGAAGRNKTSSLAGGLVVVERPAAAEHYSHFNRHPPGPFKRGRANEFG
jgi:hypothetical protein